MATCEKVLSGTVPPSAPGSVPSVRWTRLNTRHAPRLVLYCNQRENESDVGPAEAFCAHFVTTPCSVPSAAAAVGLTHASMETLPVSFSAAGLPIETLLFPAKLNACPTFPVVKPGEFAGVPFSKVGPWMSLKFPSAAHHATMFAGGS